MTVAVSRQDGTQSSGAALPHSLLDRSGYKSMSFVLLGATGSAAIYFAVKGPWYNAIALAALALLGFGFIAAKDRLPSIFTFLFLIAALFNTIGYLFDLWKTPLWFDEAIHAFTSFTIAAAIGWVALARTKMLADANGWKVTLSVVGIGLVLGAAWEVFEWIIGIIGSPADTVIDLVMDTIGALAAGLFCAWAGKENRGEHADPARMASPH